MADATDSKSVVRKGVWVQVPPPVFKNLRETTFSGVLSCRIGALDRLDRLKANAVLIPVFSGALDTFSSQFAR
jgi:hypothetical protein